MYLILDESLRETDKVIGCVCIPDDIFEELEAKALAYRIKNNLWGEVKWKAINSAYAAKIIGFLDIYLQHPMVTFHTWAYKEFPASKRIDIYGRTDVNEIFYSQCYALLRSTMDSCFAETKKFDFRILADSTGKAGEINYQKMREMFAKDRRTNHFRLNSCIPVDSKALNAVQAIDLVTGAIAKGYYSNDEMAPAKMAVLQHIIAANSGIALNITSIIKAGRSEVKVHHCHINKYWEMKQK